MQHQRVIDLRIEILLIRTQVMIHQHDGLLSVRNIFSNAVFNTGNIQCGQSLILNNRIPATLQWHYGIQCRGPK